MENLELQWIYQKTNFNIPNECLKKKIQENNT